MVGNIKHMFPLINENIPGKYFFIMLCLYVPQDSPLSGPNINARKHPH